MKETIEMDFQHSQPQSVYRSKNYRGGWGLAGIYLLIALISAPRALNDPTLWNIAAALIWLVVGFQNWWQSQRTRLVMSPAGISVTFAFGRSAATPWSNVERIQVLTVGSRLRPDAMACLVLREPSEGTLKLITRGIPDELKGRVIPLYPTLWERLSELEQELDGYLPGEPDGGRLSGPHISDAIKQRQDLTTGWILVFIIVTVGLGFLCMVGAMIW
jgi:hypothetical protein